MADTKKKSPPKYEVPEEVKQKAREFLRDFMLQQNIKPPALAIKCKEVYGRSDSRTSMLNKIKRASFKLTEIMQIVDMFGYELRIVPKNSIEGHKDNKPKS